MCKRLHLMSAKPVIYCANVTEFDLKNGNDYTKKVEEYAKTHGADVVLVSAKIESELAELDAEEAKEYGLIDSILRKREVSKKD